MKKNNLLLLNIFFLTIFCSGCAGNHKIEALESKVATLEEENAKLTKQYNSIINEDFITLEKEQREKYAEVRDMMESLKTDIQAVRGNLEESEHRLKEASEAAGASELGRIDNAVSNNYRRILRIEKHLGLESSDPADSGLVSTSQTTTPVAPNTSSIQQPVVTGNGTESTNKTIAQNMSVDSLYNEAKASLDSGKNEQARNQFEAFINRYPTSDNADNARFWIADSYYRDKWYEKAILEYQRVIEEYPKGNKIPSALLKQAYSFANLGEKGNARLILEDLIKKYPQTQESESAKEKLKTLN
ncbi:MAG: tol-pal system protein YbgF [Desulfamplus sp.]|nr:tol-pal system protein YbgF [Desulfamplus sp.]